MKKIAVVLFNLGGPDSLQAVKPFLFNLFNDSAIISVPQPFRYLLAKLISLRRGKEAQKIYASLGGASPLLENTNRQALSLSKALIKEKRCTFKVFVSMRHWNPFFSETLEEIKIFDPNEVIFIPLYPQFSTTTTGSFYGHVQHVLKQENISFTPIFIRSYPDLPELIEAMFDLSRKILGDLYTRGDDATLLFSAHGLPEHIVKKGDPYPEHLERTCKALKAKIENIFPGNKFDIRLCYQSKVGPLPWLKPSLEEEIKLNAQTNKGIVIFPISFVSEHSETLFELDQYYKDLAVSLGALFYFRIPTASTHPSFIRGLQKLVFEKVFSPEASTE